MKWQETEFYAFFHYGMNTYTGLEWGNGDERKDRLGILYDDVQAKVNEIYKHLK